MTDSTITVDWYNAEETAVCMTFAARWTIDDLYLALDAAHAFQDSKAPAPVFLIVDARQVRAVPRNLVPAANYANRQRRSNSPKLFVLTANSLLKGMADLLARLSPQDYQTMLFVADEAELAAAMQAHVESS